MVEYKNLSGLDKVAILFKTLGVQLASQLFKGISPQDLNRIKLKMDSLSDIPFKVKKTVLEEFYFSFIQEKIKPATEETKKPFEFLEKLTDEQVVYLISNEPPRIMALAIAQLDVERQSRVIQMLEPTMQPKATMKAPTLRPMRERWWILSLHSKNNRLILQITCGEYPALRPQSKIAGVHALNG